MFRSSFVMLAMSIVVVSIQSGIGFGQEPAPSGAAPSTGLQLQPATVVQTPADVGSLTKKVSFMIGFNMMTRAQSENPKMDVNQVIEGMKAANSGVDRLGYVTGYQMMTGLNQQLDGMMDVDRIFAGMTTASTGQELGMTDEEVQVMMAAFSKIMEKRAAEKLKVQADENLSAGKAYMAKNAENPKVQTLDNGVQFEVLVDGTGAQPTAEDRVKLHYEGSFIDGSVFDSSINPAAGGPANPIELVVGQFVPGFSKALQSMKVGSKWRVVIPGALGYGAGGRGKIGPNQTLIFEISLLEIIKK